MSAEDVVLDEGQVVEARGQAHAQRLCHALPRKAVAASLVSLARSFGVSDPARQRAFVDGIGASLVCRGHELEGFVSHEQLIAACTIILLERAEDICGVPVANLASLRCAFLFSRLDAARLLFSSEASSGEKQVLVSALERSGLSRPVPQECALAMPAQSLERPRLGLSSLLSPAHFLVAGSRR